MIGKGRNGTCRFICNPNKKVKQVSVAGDFNEWQPIKMRKQKNGSYAASIEVPPGEHEYKFQIDGEWQLDNDQDCHVPNSYGTMNSIVYAG